MKGIRYRRCTGSVFSLKYHLVWCPKYRSQVLVGEIAEGLRSRLYQEANKLVVKVEALEMMPDHGPMYIESDPSRILRQKYPHLRSRLPGLGSRSYSIGTVCDETVRHDIEMQKLR